MCPFVCPHDTSKGSFRPYFMCTSGGTLGKLRKFAKNQTPMYYTETFNTSFCDPSSIEILKKTLNERHPTNISYFVVLVYSATHHLCGISNGVCHRNRIRMLHLPVIFIFFFASMPGSSANYCKLPNVFFSCLLCYHLSFFAWRYVYLHACLSSIFCLRP